MSDIVIRADRLSKLYRIGEREKHSSLRDVIMNGLRRPFAAVSKNGDTCLPSGNHKNTLWALKDVSFEVKQGEVVGLIGRNGAGKSTLLKILSRITEPTEGCGEIYGRVGSLLEIGTGFHPDLTGRENVFLNGAILGMRKNAIKRRFDEIVAFAEVEKFIDTPVKYYSSGMYVRLAFAVAAHLDPEVLLVDEVLAVGDTSFQRKCLGKMQEAAEAGKTILFISHNVESVQTLCQRCLWLGEGKLLMDRESYAVAEEYLKQSYGDIRSHYRIPDFDKPPDETRARLLEAEILDAMGAHCDHLRFGETFTVRMVWEQLSEILGVSYSIRVHDEYGRFLLAVNTIGSALPIESRGIHDVLCRFDPNILVPGTYYFSIGSYVRPQTTINVVERCLRLLVSKIPFQPSYPFNIVGAPLVALRPEWSKNFSTCHDQPI